MCTGKCSRFIAISLYPLAVISIICNIVLFFPDGDVKYAQEKNITVEVTYMGGLVGGGIMVSCNSSPNLKWYTFRQKKVTSCMNTFFKHCVEVMMLDISMWHIHTCQRWKSQQDSVLFCFVLFTRSSCHSVNGFDYVTMSGKNECNCSVQCWCQPLGKLTTPSSLALPSLLRPATGIGPSTLHPPDWVKGLLWEPLRGEFPLPGGKAGIFKIFKRFVHHLFFTVLVSSVAQ